MERGNRVWCPKVLKKKKAARSGAHTGKKVFSSLSVSQKKSQVNKISGSFLLRGCHHLSYFPS